MDKESYVFHKAPIDNEYFFMSNGVLGNIAKMVSIRAVQSEILILGDKKLYNLAFGNLRIVNGELVLDDSIRSNNGDMPKVLATVAQIAISFLLANKGVSLTFRDYMDEKSAGLGRNQRNILYQRAINSNWLELSSIFEIWGFQKTRRHKYVPGVDYDAILIEHK